MRRIAFWLAVVLLASLTVALDRDSFFVYIPRWTIGTLAALLFLPLLHWSKLGERAVAVVLLAVLPYALAPIRWNLLKAFYVDCESLRAGTPMADALRTMAPYEDEAPDWAGARMAGVRETTEEYSSRILIIPSDEYSGDWCVLYPDGDRLARVVIHPD